MLFNSKRFRHPHAHEPLLARLGEAGFEMRGANVEGRPTFTFARTVPPWMRPKLDWIALRGLKPVPAPQWSFPRAQASSRHASRITISSRSMVQL